VVQLPLGGGGGGAVVVGGRQPPSTQIQSGAGLMVVQPVGGGGGGGAGPLGEPSAYEPPGPPPDANDVTSVLPMPLNWRALNVVSHVFDRVLDDTRS
jgi:hypothetical protein